MKFFIAVLVLLAFLNQISSVQHCYECKNDKAFCEKQENLKNVTCSEQLGEDRHYLCESNTKNGTVTKGCILNESGPISECDNLNEDQIDSTSCYHCDREYCNSTTFPEITLVVITFTTIVSCVLNFL